MRLRELLRTNNPVLLARVVAALADDGIEGMVFDTHTSVVEGSIGAIPRRVMVLDEDYWRASLILAALKDTGADV